MKIYLKLKLQVGLNLGLISLNKIILLAIKDTLQD